MRLTNSIRDAIVAEIMSDVPKRDYEEEITSYFQRELLAAAPKHVQETYKSHKHWLETGGVYLPQVGWRYFYCTNRDNSALDKQPVSEDVVHHVVTLCAAFEAQVRQAEALDSKLRGIVYSVSTTNKLRELLPEFAKYIPEDAAKTPNLPALANLAADFIKAGWPKGAPAP